MPFEFFVIPILDPKAAARELNSFLAGHRVLKVERKLVEEHSGVYWAICVEYQAAGANRGESNRRARRVDYREVLPPEEFEVFAEMRRWRKEQAELAGVPPYQVFTNEHLATVVRQRIQRKDELGGLVGIGPARLERYGGPLVEAFAQRLAALDEAEDTTDEAPADSP